MHDFSRGGIREYGGKFLAMLECGAGNDRRAHGIPAQPVRHLHRHAIRVRPAHGHQNRVQSVTLPAKRFDLRVEDHEFDAGPNRPAPELIQVLENQCGDVQIRKGGAATAIVEGDELQAGRQDFPRVLGLGVQSVVDPDARRIQARNQPGFPGACVVGQFITADGITARGDDILRVLVPV